MSAVVAVALSDGSCPVVATARLARAACCWSMTRALLGGQRGCRAARCRASAPAVGAPTGLDVGKIGRAARLRGLDAAPAVQPRRARPGLPAARETLGSIAIPARRSTSAALRPVRSPAPSRRRRPPPRCADFHQAPYDRFVTTNSRFWNAGGVDVKIGADGVQVNTNRSPPFASPAASPSRRPTVAPTKRCRQPRLPPVRQPRRGPQATAPKPSPRAALPESIYAGCRWSAPVNSAASSSASRRHHAWILPEAGRSRPDGRVRSTPD